MAGPSSVTQGKMQKFGGNRTILVEALDFAGNTNSQSSSWHSAGNNVIPSALGSGLRVQ